MIYLDNAATSFPKPREVIRETAQVLSSPLGNPGRSGHKMSLESTRLIFQAREDLAVLLSLKKSENIVFTGGATASLNLAIQGSVEEKRRVDPNPLVVTSVFEHNSVLRPLFSLEKKGKIRLRILSPEPGGNLPFSQLLHPIPSILVLTCRSNITGHSFSLKSILPHLKSQGTLVILDAAQALGGTGCTMLETGADILCAPGHKGLLGIMGGGIMAFSDTCPILPEAILSGGSGIDSFDPFMPRYLPERLEAGTLPLPAIVSMSAGARFLTKLGLEEVTHREREVKKILLEGIANLRDYVLYEPKYPDGPLLFNRKGMGSEALADALERHGILARAGFHCAPLAHRFLGTEETGGVRLSPGPFTTKKDVLRTLEILYRL